MADPNALGLVHPDPRGFETTNVWIFDLDNTLYPARCNLFTQIHDRMGSFIAEHKNIDRAAAYLVQKQYYREYGTTLAGLMAVDGIDPQSFLDHVHDIDYSPVPRSPELAAALAALPGRRLILTNGSRRHAENVTDRLGITHLIEGVFDISDALYIPKPRAEPYARFLQAHGIEARGSAMFEDLAVNLKVPAELGMTTVLIGPGMAGDPGHDEIIRWRRLPDHVHHMTDELTRFLTTTCAVPRTAGI